MLYQEEYLKFVREITEEYIRLITIYGESEEASLKWYKLNFIGYSEWVKTYEKYISGEFNIKIITDPT